MSTMEWNNLSDADHNTLSMVLYNNEVKLEQGNSPSTNVVITNDTDVS